MQNHCVIKSIFLCAFIFVSSISFASERWSEEKANAWAKKTPWLAGANFSPSTAINQLEMWQAESFDPATIDKELGWAQEIGFNSVRVFLHHLLWQQDSTGFLQRMDQFLQIAGKHGIGVMFVLLDGCWDPFPTLGKQRDPKPFVHNSGWVQCPGQEILKDPKRHDELEGYIKGVISHFKYDKRIQVWDIYNEPDNDNKNSYGKVELNTKGEMAYTLLKKAFAWAHSMQPSQPVTAGVWAGDWSSPEKLSPINKLMLEESDVITFHNYTDLPELQSRVQDLKKYNRPVLCTEYMARPVKSTFQAILPYLKKEHIAAYNWGFVAGKTQTIFPWDSWLKPYTGEPELWFHDIFRKDGTPYLPSEIEAIKKETK